MLYYIKQPKTRTEFNHYYQLRWKLLRAPWNQPEGSEVDEMEARCFHLMAIDTGKQIIGIARLQSNSNQEAQIRYMAVSPSYQRQGIGRTFIKNLEQQAKNNAHTKIVLDAREPSINFYKRLGYRVIKKSYLLFDEIQHFRMSKNL